MALLDIINRKTPKSTLEQILVPGDENWFEEDDGWPDLTEFDSYIIVKWNDPVTIKEVLSKFAAESEGPVSIEKNFILGPIADTKYWTAIRIPEMEEVLPAQSFWCSLNLLEAFQHLCKNQFLLALPKDVQDRPLFAEMDHSNEFKDTVIGCYNEENFQFMLPEGEMMKGPLPEEFDLPDYLETCYEFDFQWLEDIGEYAGSMDVVLRFET